LVVQPKTIHIPKSRRCGRGASIFPDTVAFLGRGGTVTYTEGTHMNEKPPLLPECLSRAPGGRNTAFLESGPPRS